MKNESSRVRIISGEDTGKFGNITNIIHENKKQDGLNKIKYLVILDSPRVSRTYKEDEIERL